MIFDVSVNSHACQHAKALLDREHGCDDGVAVDVPQYVQELLGENISTPAQPSSTSAAAASSSIAAAAPCGSDGGVTELAACPRQRSTVEKRRDRLLLEESLWGRCPHHGNKLVPHVMKSGAMKGHIRLYCSRWFQWRKPPGWRCWHNVAFDFAPWASLPKPLQLEYSNISAALARGQRR